MLDNHVLSFRERKDSYQLSFDLLLGGTAVPEGQKEREIQHRKSKQSQYAVPLPLSLGLYRKRIYEIRTALTSMFPKKAWRWAELAQILVSTTVFHGRAFPSAQAVSQGIAGKRTFWRMVKFLEDNGLLRRSARWRDDGYRTSNEYDLWALLKLLVQWIRELEIWPIDEQPGWARRMVRHISDQIYLKFHDPPGQEWLMGLPIEWTGLKPLEMVSYQHRQQSFYRG
mgnify:CR=1 FL=1